MISESVAPKAQSASENVISDQKQPVHVVIESKALDPRAPMSSMLLKGVVSTSSARIRAMLQEDIFVRISFSEK